MQVATELILGFPKNFINKEILSRQQHLWTECLDGFICVPINLPGFGKLRPPYPSACSYRPGALKHFHNVENALLLSPGVSEFRFPVYGYLN